MVKRICISCDNLVADGIFNPEDHCNYETPKQILDTEVLPTKYRFIRTGVPKKEKK